MRRSIRRTPMTPGRRLAWVPVLVIAFAGLGVPAASAAPAPAATANRPAVTPPVAFTRNVGQAASGVRYLGGASGAGIAFTDTGVTLRLAGAAPVTLRFEGADPHPRITGADRVSGTVNYLHGAEPARWHTGLPGYSRVVYHDLWPGIDAAFDARSGTLKYSFTLAPAANPDRIRLAYDGVRRVSVGGDGALAVSVGKRVLRDEAPVSRQGRGRVATRYRLLGGTAFGFTLARHTAGRPLTIDPGLEYSTFLGGAGTDNSARDVHVDADGNLYLFGVTTGADFPVTSGAYQSTLNADSQDLTVTKFDPTGTHLIYSTFIGGSQADFDDVGDVGPDGSAYLAIHSQSTDFPLTDGAYRRRPFPADVQTLAAKLDPTGSRLVYSTYLAPELAPTAARVGADGTLTIGGHTTSDFAPTTEGAYETAYAGGANTGYVARLNAAGSGLVFGTYLGPAITDQVSTQRAGNTCFLLGFDVDDSGATYATGECSNGFPVTPGGRAATNTGLASLLVKLAPTGRKVDYATYIGDTGSKDVRADAVAVDHEGRAFVVSDSPQGAVAPTPDAYASTCVSTDFTPYCAVLTEFDPSGAVLYSSYFASTGGVTSPRAVAVDDHERAYIAGATGTGLPTTPGAYSDTPGDFAIPFFLAVLGRGGLAYSTYFGGTGSTCLGVLCGFVVGDIRIAPESGPDGVYLGGTTASDKFPVTPGAFQTAYPGGINNAFAAKLTLPELPATG